MLLNSKYEVQGLFHAMFERLKVAISCKKNPNKTNKKNIIA